MAREQPTHSAIEACPKCRAPVIFATAPRGRVPFDAAPVRVGLPKYSADLANTRAAERAVELRIAYRPHAETCSQTPHGHAGHVAPDD